MAAVQCRHVGHNHQQESRNEVCGEAWRGSGHCCSHKNEYLLLRADALLIALVHVPLEVAGVTRLAHICVWVHVCVCFASIQAVVSKLIVSVCLSISHQ